MSAAARPNTDQQKYSMNGSTEMYALHEALAREHMRERASVAERHRLASEMAAGNRAVYLARRAEAARARRESRAERVVAVAMAR